jgi:molybdopterin/thiamine biosynthesis adenylyltransferase
MSITDALAPRVPGSSRAPLNSGDREIYDWQMLVPGMGEAGQERLKAASVLVTRTGGVGGTAALQLAAAGIGRLVIAHGGATKPSDLNRQLLMSRQNLGRSRVAQAARRLREMNPDVEVVAIAENACDANADRLVADADVVIDAAPLFAERFALNRAVVTHGKPMVECAMYAMELQITTIVPGRTPCLRCLYPDDPVDWKRRFPVFGAIAGTVGCLAAAEAIKLITGIGKPLTGRLMTMDLGVMSTRELRVRRLPDCPVCSHVTA